MSANSSAKTLFYQNTELWLAYPVHCKVLCTAGTRDHWITSLFGLHNGTTDPCRMPHMHSSLEVHTRPDSCVEAPVITKGSAGVRLCFPAALLVRSYWKWWSWGGWTCRQSLLLYLQDSNTTSEDRRGKVDDSCLVHVCIWAWSWQHDAVSWE